LNLEILLSLVHEYLDMVAAQVAPIRNSAAIALD
jgi:hypothetical protein